MATLFFAPARAQAWALLRASPRALPLQQPIRSFGAIHEEGKWKEGPFRSNAEELVAKVPVIEVDGPVAICNGGGGALGHPVEYIQLNTVTPGDIGECKYCGLRYTMRH